MRSVTMLMAAGGVRACRASFLSSCCQGRWAGSLARMRQRGVGYRLSQRCCKVIEALLGEAKDWHGLRRFRWRGLHRVRHKAHLIGCVLNLKRLARGSWCL
jgi:Transposase DDE domain